MKLADKRKTETYFVALLLPQAEAAKVQELKEAGCTRFGSCASLASLPHITLHMPFKWPEKKRDQLIELLNLFTFPETELLVETRGIAAFGKRVIFLDVCLTENLRLLQKNLAAEMRKNLGLLNATHKDHGYQPHITICYRDLKRAAFPEALAYYKELAPKVSFKADKIALMKKVAKSWQVHSLHSW